MLVRDNEPRLPEVLEVGSARATLVWDAAEEIGGDHPLLAEATRAGGRAAVLAALGDRLPVARTCKPFMAAPYCRPTIHRRTIYLEGDDGGTLAFKGTEPHAEDLAAEIAHLEAMRAPFNPSMLNNFAIGEHKVPMAMSLREAMKEATRTLHFQLAYWERFGRVARAPLHLRVYRWDTSVGDRLLAMLAPSLTEIAMNATRRLVAEGLGAVVYHYPGLPLRVSEAARDRVAAVSRAGGIAIPFGTGIHNRAGVSFAKRLGVLRERAEPWVVVRSWLGIVADMMVAGFFPLHAYYMGHCLQAQNLCIDGGIADTDSITPMREVEGPMFSELFVWTAGELVKSVTIYLTGTYIGRYSDQMIGVTVWEQLHTALAKRLAERPAVDPRLEELVRADPFERLHRVLDDLLQGEVPPNAPYVG